MERINLRLIDSASIVDDARNVIRWASDPDVKRALRYFSFFQEEQGMDRQIAYLNGMIKSYTDKMFVIETESGEFLGTCGMHGMDFVNDNTRIGIIIFNKNYWRQGYGRLALSLLLRHAFVRLDMNKVYLTARADNAVAIHIYNKLGFQPEGILRKEYKVKKGEYLDLLRMSILKSEWRK